MKYTLFLKVAAILLLVSFISCGEAKQNQTSNEQPLKTNVKELETKKNISSADNSAEQEVLAEAVSFYKSISEGSFNGAIEFLHPKAVEATPKSQWLKLFEDTKVKFGKLLKTNIIDSRKFDGVMTVVGKADYYQIAFENIYEKGTLYEMLSFIKERKFIKAKLLSYNYNSDKTKLQFEKFDH